MGNRTEAMIEQHEARLAQVGDAAVEGLLRQILAKQDEMEKMFMGAFPGGDVEGHKRYHEEVILQMQDRRKLRQAVREQIIKGSVWALGIAMCTAAWQYFKQAVKLP